MEILLEEETPSQHRSLPAKIKQKPMSSFVVDAQCLCTCQPVDWTLLLESTPEGSASPALVLQSFLSTRDSMYVHMCLKERTEGRSVRKLSNIDRFAIGTLTPGILPTFRSVHLSRSPVTCISRESHPALNAYTCCASRRKTFCMKLVLLRGTRNLELSSPSQR